MSRGFHIALPLCAALAPLAAQADDNLIETTLGTNGWGRSFESGAGSADERVVAAARAPDGGYCSRASGRVAQPVP